MNCKYKHMEVHLLCPHKHMPWTQLGTTHCFRMPAGLQHAINIQETVHSLVAKEMPLGKGNNNLESTHKYHHDT